MDIALAIEKLLPAAEYRGSVVMNTPACWGAVSWTDSRIAKPTWAELESAWTTLESTLAASQRIKEIKAQLHQLDQDAIRPLCTILAADTDEDVTGELQIIAYIEDSKKVLRAELVELEGDGDAS